VSRDDALLKLGESTLAAIAGVLATLAPDGVEPGGVAIVPNGVSPLASVPLPAVAVSVSYVDGVTGGNVFVFPQVGAKRLAAAMMGAEPEDLEGELTELELSAVGEAMNQMMAAAAAATGVVLGSEVTISTPTTTFVTTAQQAADLCPADVPLTTASLSLLGEPCRLIQLIPNAFLVRLTRALGDLATEEVVAQFGSAAVAPESLHSVPVRISAELGRTRLPIGRAVGLEPGTVVELDRAFDDPVDLFVSGQLIGRGSLVVADGEWAVQVIEIVAPDVHLSAIQQGEN
jgi:flagellar motor switch protein FliN